jgi:hypothetical protein
MFLSPYFGEVNGIFVSLSAECSVSSLTTVAFNVRLNARFDGMEQLFTLYST